MPDHLQHPPGHHHHHRHAGHGHPPAAVYPSILRLSALERLAAALAVVAVLWIVVLWALR